MYVVRLKKRKNTGIIKFSIKLWAQMPWIHLKHKLVTKIIRNTQLSNTLMETGSTIKVINWEENKKSFKMYKRKKKTISNVLWNLVVRIVKKPRNWWLKLNWLRYKLTEKKLSRRLKNPNVFLKTILFKIITYVRFQQKETD